MRLSLLAAASAAAGASAARSLTITNACASAGVVIPTLGTGQQVSAPAGGWRLEAGASFTLSWPQAPTSADIIFSGNFAFCADEPPGRCACDAAAAAAGPAPSATACRFADDGPRTLAEITLQARAEDFYDVSIINGVAPAVALGPAPRSAGAAGPGAPLAAGPFHCAKAGGGGASWRVEPPPDSALHYRAVRGGSGAACTDSAPTCAAAGEECGLAKRIGESPSFRLACGLPLGSWTPAQVCGSDASFNEAPFFCATPVANGPTATSTRWTFYGCTDGISSCFSAGAAPTCCGCTTWSDVAGVPQEAGAHCASSNAEWLAVALPQLEPFKRACPTCYVFPYDDVSSTFTCSAFDTATGLNEANYALTFCPAAEAA